MFNTVALILRPEEIRLFIVLFGALAAAAVAAVARWLRRVLALAVERGRRGIPGPLARVLSSPLAASLVAAVSLETSLACGWIEDGLGRLMCRWTRRRPLSPRH